MVALMRLGTTRRLRCGQLENCTVTPLVRLQGGGPPPDNHAASNSGGGGGRFPSWLIAWGKGLAQASHTWVSLGLLLPVRLALMCMLCGTLVRAQRGRDSAAPGAAAFVSDQIPSL